MRIGRLGVVDVGDAVNGRDRRDSMRIELEGQQTPADRTDRYTVRARQRGSGECVGDVVRCPGRDVADTGELGRVAIAALDEGPIGQYVVDDTEHADRRHPQA